jgi:geranyl diphosphate 2-C-methyltransferase
MEIMGDEVAALRRAGYWDAVGAHFDRKGRDDMNYLSSPDGLIVHHHTGLFPDGVTPEADSEEALLRLLWHAENRLVERAAALLDLRPGEEGFDCGCGRGGSSFLFARDFGARMTGITVSETQARFAREAAAQLGLAGQCAFHLENIYDGRQPSGAFDFIWACESTEYMPDRPRLFAEWWRLLRPGGRALGIILTYVESRRHLVARELAQLDAYYVGSTGPFHAYLDAAVKAGFLVDDVTPLERETIPYWDLRTRSAHQKGTEAWLRDGLRSGALRFSAMLFRKPRDQR